jgi:hypothetical protein
MRFFVSGDFSPVGIGHRFTILLHRTQFFY